MSRLARVIAKSAHLSRRYMIHVCKDGTVTYRDTSRRERVFNGVALPVFSVDTEAQAVSLQVMFCRRGYEEHPQLPGQTWYRLSTLGDGAPLLRPLELSDLDRVTEMFQRFWDVHLTKERRASCTVID